jgi:hypothetical protein
MIVCLGTKPRVPDIIELFLVIPLYVAPHISIIIIYQWPLTINTHTHIYNIILTLLNKCTTGSHILLIQPIRLFKQA